MDLETEVKIRVERKELEGVRARLRKGGGRLLASRREEKNLLFDYPDGRLRNSGCALRLRTYGKKALLTFKGRVKEDPHFKKRPEGQTEVKDPEAMREILAALNLKVSFRYAKIREMWEWTQAGRRVEIAVDETPVGAFVELEGPESAVIELAKKFGWGLNSFVRTGYTELYSAAGLGKET